MRAETAIGFAFEVIGLGAHQRLVCATAARDWTSSIGTPFQVTIRNDACRCWFAVEQSSDETDNMGSRVVAKPDVR